MRDEHSKASDPAVGSTRLVMPPGWEMLGRGNWTGPHNASVTYECRKWWLWQLGISAKGPFNSKEEAAWIAV